MHHFEAIRIEKADQITTVALNRPETHNAFIPRTHFEMCEALEELAHDADTRVLIITGAGESFCTGNDLKLWRDSTKDPVLKARAEHAWAHWRLRLLRFFPAPTIAMVKGYCFGGALQIVGVCDLAVAAEDATFGLSEINFGGLPGTTIPRVIMDLLPFRDALYYTLTGERFNGKKAAELRFVNFAVPRAQLEEATLELAGRLKEKDPQALTAAKVTFKAGRDMNYEEMAFWTAAKANELRLSTGDRWSKGLEQFREGKYRPGLESYEWRSS